VRAVEVVLEHQLPVAVVGVLEDAARHLELAARRAIDEVVERCSGRTQKSLEISPVEKARRR
jgi:hypothetical protein